VECNVFAISPTNEARQPSTTAPGVKLYAEAAQDGFHGRLYVGALSASPPALQASSGAAVSRAPSPTP
jgi:hypothetical protein